MIKMEDYVDCVIRDGLDSNNVLKVKSIPYKDFKLKLEEYENKKSNKKNKCSHWLLHNFPNLNLKTKCKDCGISVEEVKKERGLI